MNLVAMSIPDDAAELPTWLEDRLVGFDLGSLVAELSAVHGSGRGLSLDAVLGQRRQSVLAQGLSVLPPSSLRQLLTNPELLAELQDLVLIEGGPYWQQRSEGNAALMAAELRSERRLATLLQPAPPLRVSPRSQGRQRISFRWLRTAAVSVASAAAVLLGVYLFRDELARRFVGPTPPQVTAETAWGWEKLDSPGPDTKPVDYLNSLADAADEWFAKRPEDAVSLARRIGAMRQGCSRLLLASHTALADDDRRWLRERCRVWAGKFDHSLSDLENGRSVDEVREEMDDTVRKVVAMLHERAKGIGQG